MWRAVASIVAGVIAWAVIVTLLNFGLRAGIPGYHAAEATLQFTTAMKVGRLLEAAISSVAAGSAVSLVEPARRSAPATAGVIVLLMFLPVHISIWDKFPAWYHLAFLVPIVPLFALGGLIARRQREALVLRHLLSTVPGQRFDEFVG